MEFVFASNNLHKTEEIKLILGNGFRILRLSDVNIDCDIPETGTTLEANAMQKAKFIKELSGKDCFADDTGLEVAALGGAPGVYSARYAGNENNAARNIEKLLHEMIDVADRRARFRTVIALIYQGAEYTFEGAVEGHIGHVVSGQEGFGYDPVFIPVGFKKTFAEMTSGEKNTISHRAKAVLKLADFLLKQDQ